MCPPNCGHIKYHREMSTIHSVNAHLIFHMRINVRYLSNLPIFFYLLWFIAIFSLLKTEQNRRNRFFRLSDGIDRTDIAKYLNHAYVRANQTVFIVKGTATDERIILQITNLFHHWIKCCCYRLSMTIGIKFSLFVWCKYSMALKNSHLENVWANIRVSIVKLFISFKSNKWSNVVNGCDSCELNRSIEFEWDYFSIAL